MNGAPRNGYLDDRLRRAQCDTVGLDPDVRLLVDAPGYRRRPIAPLELLREGGSRRLHRVELEREGVRSYRILAPTEWNFHPAGAAAQGLIHLPAQDTAVLRRLAALLINAVDPCVGYDLRVD